MRFGTFTAIVVIAAAASAACSLLLPYDDYPGVPDATAPPPADDEDAGNRDATTAPPTPPIDAGVPVVIDGGGSHACPGVELATDTNNCGACGRRCLTGTCAAGQCPIETLTPAGASRVVSLEYALSADLGEHMYFTRESGVLGRVRLDGSQVEQSTTTKATRATSLSMNGKVGIFGALAAVWVYRTSDFTTATPERITNAPGLGPVHYTGQLAYFGDGKGIWWLEPKAGATVYGLLGSAPLSLTTSGPRIYWSAASGEVFTMKAGDPGAPTKLVSTGRAGLTSMAVASANVFLAHPGQALVIYDHDATALTVSNPRAVPLEDVEAVATDDAHVYALDFPGDHTAGRLLRLNLDGQELAVLATGLEPSYALTVAGDYVYFASGARIQRTAK